MYAAREKSHITVTGKQLYDGKFLTGNNERQKRIEQNL